MRIRNLFETGSGIRGPEGKIRFRDPREKYESGIRYKYPESTTLPTIMNLDTIAKRLPFSFYMCFKYLCLHNQKSTYNWESAVHEHFVTALGGINTS
jgi:hypothetical protein